MYRFELIPKEKLQDIIPLLLILNPDIESAILEKRVQDMRETNYECVGVFDQHKLIGISGLWILYKYYVGKHLELDNVVLLPEYRGKGIGEKLIEWIFEYARSKGCTASELNVYVQNQKGLRFWISQGYHILGFHCQKIL